MRTLLRSCALFFATPFAGLFLSLVALVGLGGCGHEAPQPVPFAEVPTALRAAFPSVKPPAASLLQAALDALAGKELPKASVALQSLGQSAGLSAKQKELVARCLISVNAELAAAAEAGDADAQEYRQIHQQEK